MIIIPVAILLFGFICLCLGAFMSRKQDSVFVVEVDMMATGLLFLVCGVLSLICGGGMLVAVGVL